MALGHAPEEQDQKSKHSTSHSRQLPGRQHSIGLDEQGASTRSLDVEGPGHEDHAGEPGCQGIDPEATPEQASS